MGWSGDLCIENQLWILGIENQIRYIVPLKRLRNGLKSFFQYCFSCLLVCPFARLSNVQGNPFLSFSKVLCDTPNERNWTELYTRMCPLGNALYMIKIGRFGSSFCSPCFPRNPHIIGWTGKKRSELRWFKLDLKIWWASSWHLVLEVDSHRVIWRKKDATWTALLSDGRGTTKRKYGPLRLLWYQTSVRPMRFLQRSHTRWRTLKDPGSAHFFPRGLLDPWHMYGDPAEGLAAQPLGSENSVGAGCSFLDTVWKKEIKGKEWKG